MRCQLELVDDPDELPDDGDARSFFAVLDASGFDVESPLDEPESELRDSAFDEPESEPCDSAPDEPDEPDDELLDPTRLSVL